MSQITVPARPVENWEEVRNDWIRAVETLVCSAATICKQHDWAARQSEKTLVDDRIGSHELPRLLFHDGEDQFLLDPIARFVPGADGLVDLGILPVYETVMIVRAGEDWRIHIDLGTGGVEALPWSGESLAAAMQTLKAQR